MGWGLGDIADAVSDVASGAGGLVEDAVDTATDLVEGAVDEVLDTAGGWLGDANGWLCVNGPSWLCHSSNVVLGGIRGLVNNASDLVEDAADLLRDGGAIVADVLRGDFCKLVNDLGNLGVDALDAGVDLTRTVTGGYIVGGWLDARDREHLRRFIDQRLEQKFSSDLPTLEKIREHIGLDRASYGLPLKAEHYVWRLDSINAKLAEWHHEGTLDLYALAHLFSDRDTCELWNLTGPAARTVVKFVDENGVEGTGPIRRSQLRKYIDSNGATGRIRVYAMKDRVVAHKTNIATKKCKRIGVDLNWNSSERFPQFGQYAVRDITERDEYLFRVELAANGVSVNTDLGDYLRNAGLRATNPGPRSPEECIIVAIGAFRYTSDKLLGACSGRSIAEGATCTTPPDRTDPCCVTVHRSGGSGVIHRDVSPFKVFEYALVHEIGHYLGLCHSGHDSPAHIMWVSRTQGWVGWSLLGYYANSGPYFTRADGENVWRFLIDQMPQCLAADHSVRPPRTPQLM